jgi:N-acetylmuramoyl-L-alanine amidase
MTLRREAPLGQGLSMWLPARLRPALHAVAVALAFAGCGPATAETPELPTIATVAYAVDMVADLKRASISFSLTRTVDAKAFVLERPDRVIVDLPEVNFQLPPQSGRTAAGLVSSFRYGLFAQGRSRIVIDLKEPALVARVTSAPAAGGEASKLVIELARTDRATYHQAALKPILPPSDNLGVINRVVQGAAAAAAADDRATIVIDPGHGGVDLGAVTASGLIEKNLVFTFAQRLKERLESTGKYRVLMTRTDDSFISLPDRVRLAREAKAALFVSIHADILSVSPEVRGATVYTGSEFATDAEAARLADKENRSDAVAGVDSRDDPEEVAGILMDLTKRETRAFTSQFAKSLVGDLGNVVKLNKNPHRSAGFRVLKAPDVPSVLVELGYLSSAKDAGLLASDSWRDRTSDAMANAIERYLAARASTPARAAVSP